METDKELDLVCENYLTQRLYSSRVPVSDGFMASLTKEFHELSKQGINVDRIIKKIIFELKKLDAAPEKESEKKFNLPISGGIPIQKKDIEMNTSHLKGNKNE